MLLNTDLSQDGYIHKIPQVNEPLESESFKVEKIILHPNFRYMLTQPDRYDIALLKLDHPVYYR